MKDQHNLGDGILIFSVRASGPEALLTRRDPWGCQQGTPFTSVISCVAASPSSECTRAGSDSFSRDILGSLLALEVFHTGNCGLDRASLPQSIQKMLQELKTGWVEAVVNPAPLLASIDQFRIPQGF
jgi:hypothetical protein